MGWADAIADVTLAVSCSGQTHRLRWRGGRVSAAAHADLAGEEALAAFGGQLPACVDALLRWRAAVRDGGFLSEWSDMDLDDPVYRHHLRVAVTRLRTEGVQDLLRALPARRAEQMGQFLLSFPQVWVDRAGLAVVRASRRAGSGRSDPAIARAVQVRTRSAFVASLARWAPVVRPAALVRFECTLLPWGEPPRVGGVLDGTASWCRVAVSPQWLLDVWGPGRTLDHHGDLRLDGAGSTLVWVPGPDGRHHAARSSANASSKVCTATTSMRPSAAWRASSA
jgi:hypothetical protein